MRWRLRRPRMVERTCLQCGEHWTVSARAARARPGSRWGRGFAAPSVLGAGTRSLSDAGMYYLQEEAHRRDATADREFETLEQWRKCPKCGSVDRYTQRRVS